LILKGLLPSSNRRCTNKSFLTTVTQYECEHKGPSKSYYGSWLAGYFLAPFIILVILSCSCLHSCNCRVFVCYRQFETNSCLKYFMDHKLTHRSYSFLSIESTVKRNYVIAYSAFVFSFFDKNDTFS